MGRSGHGFKPYIGTCAKCETEASYLYEYKPNYFICKANGCWSEEKERDSRIEKVRQRNLDDYRKITSGSGPTSP